VNFRICASGDRANRLFLRHIRKFDWGGRGRMRARWHHALRAGTLSRAPNTPGKRRCSASSASRAGSVSVDAETKNPSARSRAMAAKAPSKSSTVRTGCRCARKASFSLAAATARKVGACEGTAGLNSTPIRVAYGRASLKISSALAVRSVCTTVSPVMLPPQYVSIHGHERGSHTFKVISVEPAA
jgi:hypothetical protein